MYENMVLFIFLFAAAVAWDANKLGVKRGTLPGLVASSGPIAWFLLCSMLWIVFFPWYLLKRDKYSRVTGRQNPYFKFAILLILALSIGSLMLKQSNKTPFVSTPACSSEIESVRAEINSEVKARGMDETVQTITNPQIISEDVTGGKSNCKAELVTSKEKYSVEFQLSWHDAKMQKVDVDRVEIK